MMTDDDLEPKETETALMLKAAMFVMLTSSLNPHNGVNAGRKKERRRVLSEVHDLLDELEERGGEQAAVFLRRRLPDTDGDAE